MAKRINDSYTRRKGSYSTPRRTVEYMVKNLLKYLPNDSGLIVDPATGDGRFLIECSKYRNDLEFLGLDLEPIPNRTDQNTPIEFKQNDFIEYFENRSTKFGDYRKVSGIIGNPPYNCHESRYIRQNKVRLKKLFKDVGVLNTYSMFIYASLNILAEGGILCMITMDSFLTNKYHQRLREYILRNSEIIEIVLAPRNLFYRQKADVRTAIITLRKTSNPNNSSLMRLVDRVDEEADYYSSPKEHIVTQSTFNQLIDKIFAIGVTKSVLRIFSNSYPALGEYVPGGAGISTGNDKEYLRVGRQLKNWIPFYKNPAGYRFYYQTNVFLTPDWLDLSSRISNFMVRNTQYFFKEGVSCSSMGIRFSAVYLPPNCLFGINATFFPSTERERYFLLGFLNSSLCSYFIRALLNRTNMVTPGYVKKLAYFYDANKQICNEISQYSLDAYNLLARNEDLLASGLLEKIDDLVFKLYEIPNDERQEILSFVDDIFNRV